LTDAGLSKRMTAVVAVVAFGFAALVTRLWFLQVLAVDDYRVRAEGNRARLIPIMAPRGQILDRNGEPLVGNRPSIQIMVDPRKVEDEEVLLSRLADLLGTTPGVLGERLNDPAYLPYQPIPVFQDPPGEAVLYLAEHRDEFPGADFESVSLRSYEDAHLAPHLIGHLGLIDEDEALDPSFDDVLLSQRVGRGGIEGYYESFLQGVNGWRKLEVDSRGRVLEQLGRTEPRPGNDVVLSLDAEIQELAHETLGDAIRAARSSITTAAGFAKAPAGAVVVLDPNNGQVLALSSFPTFDPEYFLHNHTQEQYDQRFDRRSRNFPLNNRAIAGLYPAGSTFKPFVAAAAINAGYASPGGYYPCPPEFIVPGDESGTVFHNWTTTDFGPIQLDRALVISCDTVFYQFGLDFYADRDVLGEYFQTQMRRWGFGRPSGIDIPAEAAGRVPDEEWKQEVNDPDDPNALWYPGDNINLSIGQGDLLVTPLQMAVAYAALANGGTLYRPQLARRVESPEGDVVKRVAARAFGNAPADPQTLEYIRTALEGVVQGEGTAAGAFAGFPLDRYPVAGKTGTAEPAFDYQASHSWFAAFAPADDPQYVVVALVEQAGHGSEVAAPIVRRIFEGLFDLTPSEFSIVGEATD
jgi:penicillin-binding protein 2